MAFNDPRDLRFLRGLLSKVRATWGLPPLRSTLNLPHSSAVRYRMECVAYAEFVGAILHFQLRSGFPPSQCNGYVLRDGPTLKALVRAADGGNTRKVSYAPPATALHPVSPRVTGFTRRGQRFGDSRPGGRRHAGIDLDGRTGALIKAMDWGVVYNSHMHFGGTNLVALEIWHPRLTYHHGAPLPGLVALYGELVAPAVRNLAVVRPDQVLGRVGAATGVLHLELYDTLPFGSVFGTVRKPKLGSYRRFLTPLDPAPFVFRRGGPTVRMA